MRGFANILDYTSELAIKEYIMTNPLKINYRRPVMLYDKTVNLQTHFDSGCCTRLKILHK